MTRDNDDGRKAFQVLQAQFDLLRKGSRATFYACREWLDLPTNPTAANVVAAVHAKLHKAAKLEGDEASGYSLATITAGHQLLKAVMA